jgi:hypothetical protein
MAMLIVVFEGRTREGKDAALDALLLVSEAWGVEINKE